MLMGEGEVTKEKSGARTVQPISARFNYRIRAQLRRTAGMHGCVVGKPVRANLCRSTGRFPPVSEPNALAEFQEEPPVVRGVG